MDVVGRVITDRLSAMWGQPIITEARPGANSNIGTGSSIHLSLELFKQVAGIQLTAIGYKGQPPVITDLIGGQLDVAFVSIGLISQHVQSGKLKALSVIGQSRAKLLPNVPTLIEAGFAEAGVVPWYAFFTRSGAPAEVTATPGAGYHVTEDLVDHAIAYAHDHVSVTPDQWRARLIYRIVGDAIDIAQCRWHDDKD